MMNQLLYPLSYFPRFEVPLPPDTRRAMVSVSAPDRHSEPVPLCSSGAASNKLQKKQNPGRRTADRGSYIPVRRAAWQGPSELNLAGSTSDPSLTRNRVSPVNTGQPWIKNGGYEVSGS